MTAALRARAKAALCDYHASLNDPTYTKVTRAALHDTAQQAVREAADALNIGSVQLTVEFLEELP